jgi:hypothetical protein
MTSKKSHLQLLISHRPIRNESGMMIALSQNVSKCEISNNSLNLNYSFSAIMAEPSQSISRARSLGDSSPAQSLLSATLQKNAERVCNYFVNGAS